MKTAELTLNLIHYLVTVHLFDIYSEYENLCPDLSLISYEVVKLLC